MKNRVYIFLDKNLSNPQKIVQSTHLGIESARKFHAEIHPSIIVLSITLEEIESIKTTLMKRDIQFVDFYEPIFDSITGLATEPISKDQGKYLQHFSTIKEKDFLNQSIIWSPPLPPNYKPKLSKDEEATFNELIKIEKDMEELELTTFKELASLSRKYYYEDGMSSPFTNKVGMIFEKHGMDLFKGVLDYWIKDDLSLGQSFSFIKGIAHGIHNSSILEASDVIKYLETLLKQSDLQGHKKEALIEAIEFLK